MKQPVSEEKEKAAAFSQNTEGLLPCPFCKDSHLTLQTFSEALDNPAHVYFVQCDNILCGASGPPGIYDHAIEKWNRYASPSPQPQVSVEEKKPTCIHAPEGSVCIACLRKFVEEGEAAEPSAETQEKGNAL